METHPHAIPETDPSIGRNPSHRPLGSAWILPHRKLASSPEVGARLRAPAVRGDMRFEFAFLAWDAWMTLHHISREPLEHNRDGSVPVRWSKPLDERLVPLPFWAGFENADNRRIQSALLLLRELDLISSRKGPSQGAPNQGVSRKGTDCLKAGRAAFFSLTQQSTGLGFLDPSKDFLDRVASDTLRTTIWRMGRDPIEFEELGRRLSRRVLEILPPTGSVQMLDMDAAFAPSHPFLYVRRMPWSERTKVEFDTEDLFEHIDEPAAKSLMVGALVHPYALGLLARGITAQGEITWGLTEAGRNWLGLPADPHPHPPRHVKVTPAFDIYFGRVDPTALAEISLYADLTAQDHGIVGKLSRASVQKACTLGIAMEEILASLDALVASPLPENVRRTIEDWERGLRSVRIRDGVVLQCADSFTADSLERLSQGEAERLSEAILLLPDRRTLATLRRKANESGILL